MASLEEVTWHESHVVWHFPPGACVHVTYGTWRMKSKCEESEEVSSLWDQTKEDIMGEEKQFGGKKKRKRRRKGEKGKEKKRKEKKEKTRKKGKKMRKNKREEENHAWRERKKKRKGLRFPVFQWSKVVSSRIKVGLLDESYE